MNLQETNVLRRLDEKVEAGTPGIIETNRGEVLIKRTLHLGFVAILKEDGGKLWNVYGVKPSVAFLSLVEQINKIN